MKSSRLLLLSACLLLALAAGCSKEAPTAQPGKSVQTADAGSEQKVDSHAQETKGNVAEPDDSGHSEQADPQEQSPQQTYDNQPAEDNETASLITPPDNSAKSPGTGETATGGKVKTESSKAWDAKAPLLLGISIGDAQDTVIAQYGKPQDEFSTEDQKETLNINEYDGFSVGYDGKYKVKFIEVYGDKVKTGLNGLRIGQSSEDAVKALGKPSNHNTYTLGYKAEGAFLKLDLDPQSNEVLSIKLFVNS